MILSEDPRCEGTVVERFLTAPDEATFGDLFKIFTPELVAFFRTRGCDLMAEDLAQEVMFTVHRKIGQLRDRSLFRAWLFKIARNALCRHYGKRSREVGTLDLTDVRDLPVASGNQRGGTPGFEFLRWVAFLNSHEKEALTLRFIEQWEYREIAAAQTITIETARWRVFNAKRKLAPYLTRSNLKHKAA